MFSKKLVLKIYDLEVTKVKKNRGPDLEKYLDGHGRRFLNYAQGAKIYRLPYWSFVRVAKEAKAVYHIKGVVLVNVEIIDEYLESFRHED